MFFRHKASFLDLEKIKEKRGQIKVLINYINSSIFPIFDISNAENKGTNKFFWQVSRTSFNLISIFKGIK